MDFSGYITADELYDGPFCVLFIVDNHKFKRLCYEVLDHNPTNGDMTRFFRRFKQMLDARGLTLKGITTDTLSHKEKKILQRITRGLDPLRTLPATSNAVERANRRHRKMQKSIYRVRTRDHISQRIAIDMRRDEYRVGVKKTTRTLHWSRSRENRKAG